jgi:hypothetical protein
LRTTLPQALPKALPLALPQARSAVIRSQILVLLSVRMLPRHLNAKPQTQRARERQIFDNILSKLFLQEHLVVPRATLETHHLLVDTSQTRQLLTFVSR